MSLNYSDLPPNIVNLLKDKLNQFVPSEELEGVELMVIYHHIRKSIERKGFDKQLIKEEHDLIMKSAPDFVKEDKVQMARIDKVVELAINDAKREQNERGAWQTA